jgi:signal transduction histidine kinase
MSLLASQTGQVIEHALQRDMLISDFDSIRSTFDDIAVDNRVQTLVMLDRQGEVIFTPDDEEIGTFKDYSDPSCQPCHSLPPEERPSGIAVTNAEGQRVFRSMHPVENQPACTRCHDPQERILGLLLTDFSIAPVEEALANDIRLTIGWWVSMGLITAIIVNLGINWMVIRRLEILAAAMSGYIEGRDHSALPETPKDEIGQLSGSYNALVNTIYERKLENQRLSDDLRFRFHEREVMLQRLITSQEQERRRVANELHDDLGQRMSSISLNLEYLLRTLPSDPESARIQISEIQGLISETTDSMHDMVFGLRPSVLDDLGIVPAIRNLCQRMLEPVEILYEIKIKSLSDRLPANVETALFRITQEAINNVIRHAEAHNVMISLRLRDDWVELEIKDDGNGFDPQITQASSDISSGLGLLGMRERVDLFHGEFFIKSAPSSGTTIQARIPLEEQDNGR